jgi:hypothetical protein
VATFLVKRSIGEFIYGKEDEGFGCDGAVK